MEDNKNKIYKDDSVLQDPENIIKNTEADTEEIVDFMHEEIKKRPVNRRKFLRMARETMAIAVLFGVVSCVVFAILLPSINNVLNPGEDTTQTLDLPEEKPSEELTPEDMVENERKQEASENREKISEELDSLLDEKVVGVEQYKRIAASMQDLASKNTGMIAEVSGITADTDLFDDAYENRNTTSGLVTKKTEIMVTFQGGVEAEAQVRGSDSVTGLTILTVPTSSVPVGNRTLIQQATWGSSVDSVITGAPVIAIGSPTGTAGSVVYGNVTGAGESLNLADNDLCRLSTDIYGSSDATGFLINLDGAVVGMIDMRYKDSNIPNMLCAVGITELSPVIHRMEEGKTKAFIGITGSDVTEEISSANSIPTGVWVTHVEDDSPAMAAGIQKGDIITGFGKNDILSMSGLSVQLVQTEPGQVVNLRIMRRNGDNFEEINVAVSTQ